MFFYFKIPLWKQSRNFWDFLISSLFFFLLSCSMFKCQSHIKAQFESYLLCFQYSSLLRHLRKKQRTIQVLGPHHPHGRPGRSSWALALAWPSPRYYSHLGNESSSWGISASPSVRHCDSQIKKTNLENIYTQITPNLSQLSSSMLKALSSLSQGGCH